MLLLGHRGIGATSYLASAHSPEQPEENTLASFELCLQHGCDGFEFDVRRTADGVAVLCHDPTFCGLEVAATQADKLALPTLNQVLECFSGRAFLDIELKVRGLESATLSALRKYPSQKGYVVSSFLPEVLQSLHALDPKIPLGFIYNSSSSFPPLDVPLAWLIPNLKLVNADLVTRTHQSGQRIMVWTVNRAVDISRLIDWGVDGIISDETKLLVPVAHSTGNTSEAAKTK